MTVLVAGEALADLVASADRPSHGAAGPPSYRAHPGGGPYNTAVALGRLAVPVQLLTRLADDTLGGLLRARAAAAGVDLSRVVPAAEPTSLALVDVDDDGRAAYAFHLTGTSAFSWRPADLPAALPGVAAVHAGTLSLAVEPSATLLTDWLLGLVDDGTDAGGAGRTGTTGPRPALSLDPNVRPDAVADLAAYRSRLLRLAAASDVVKASDEDLAVLFPGDAPARAAERLRESGARLVVVTAGSAPAHACWAGGTAEQVVPAVPVVDTVGAGDSFVAGLLAALHEAGVLRRGLPGLDGAVVATALEAAAQTSAMTVGRAGADPPDRSLVPALGDVAALGDVSAPGDVPGRDGSR